MTKGKQINITTQARFQTISKSTNNKQIRARIIVPLKIPIASVFKRIKDHLAK